ncbi:MAG: YeeE/YedE family protein [Deltaproteobacteria bacterium]|nr:YeeE/YedE family protein [Deltaproteobacteria bacterium]
MTQEKPFWNPYVGGFVLGLVLLGSFLVVGNGLGASGAANRLGVGAAYLVAPETVAAHEVFGEYAGPGKNVLDDWLVFEVLGVFLGGALGAYSAGRMRRGIQGGPRPLAPWKRLAFAFAGGLLMGVAARLARGCTSGQALTGGALLSAGSWAFMMMVFAGGYLAAPFLRRQWR